jgi:hypothetical protein
MKARTNGIIAVDISSDGSFTNSECKRVDFTSHGTAFISYSEFFSGLTNFANFWKQLQKNSCHKIENRKP